jgi:hypothetical protein
MDPECFKALRDIPFPEGSNPLSKMHIFSGVTRMFAPFVPGYADAAALLHSMTSLSFNWDTRTWKHDYVGAFNAFKDLLSTHAALFYPDYSLEWILSWDASETALGGALWQVRVMDGKEVRQPILFISHKFSVGVCKWHIFEKEAYAGVYCIKKCAHLLRGRSFVMETDARNLIALEKFEIPKMIRICNFYKFFHA